MKKKTENCHSPVFANNLPEIQRLINTKSPSFMKTKGSKSISRIGNHSKKSSHREFVLPQFIDKTDSRLSLDLNAFSNFMSDSSAKPALVIDPNVELLNMGSPAGRKEIQKLIEWLDAMLQNVVDNKKNPDELFEMTNEIYTCCLKEVIRQVSVHCKERGYLISRVWVAYKNLFEKALHIAKSNENLLKEKLAKESQQKNKESSQLIESFQAKISSLSESIQTLSKEKQEAESICSSYKSEISNNVEKIAYIQERYKILRKELIYTREENRILNIKLLNFSDTAPKPKFAQKKFKIKSVKDLSSMLAKDPVMSILKLKDSNIMPMTIKYEQELNEVYRRDDYRDTGTDAPKPSIKDSPAQTEVEFLCGESQGIKKRQNRFKYSSYTYKPVRNTLPDIPEYTQRALNFETQLLLKNPNIPELKKKHLRVRRLLSTVKEVIKKQEY